MRIVRNEKVKFINQYPYAISEKMRGFAKFFTSVLEVYDYIFPPICRYIPCVDLNRLTMLF